MARKFRFAASSSPFEGSDQGRYVKLEVRKSKLIVATRSCALEPISVFPIFKHKKIWAFSAIYV
jgi:hypothetical protein